MGNTVGTYTQTREKRKLIKAVSSNSIHSDAYIHDPDAEDPHGQSHHQLGRLTESGLLLGWGGAGRGGVGGSYAYTLIRMILRCSEGACNWIG